MTEAQIFEQLTTILREFFSMPTLVATPELTAAQVDGWDSLSHIDLLVTIEEAFSIRIPAREVSGMKNVGDLVRAIKAKLK